MGSVTVLSVVITYDAAISACDTVSDGRKIRPLAEARSIEMLGLLIEMCSVAVLPDVITYKAAIGTCDNR